jgi:hypothetical protein
VYKLGPVEEKLVERTAVRAVRRAAIPPAPLPPTEEEKTHALWAGAGAGAGAAPGAGSKRPVARPALPSAGTSYNPELDAHQDALGEVVAEAVEVERRRAAIRARLPLRPGEVASLADRDRHDPDADVDGEVEIDDEDAAMILDGVEGARGAGGAAGSAAGAGKPGKRKRIRDPVKRREADVAAFTAELEAAHKGADEELKRVKREEERDRESGGKPRRVAKSLAEHEALVSSKAAAVPLSEELTGSLRSIKALPAGSLVAERLHAAAASGLAHKRDAKYAPAQVGADGNVTVLTRSDLAKLKGTGKPWRLVEFPRNRGFEPAEEIAKKAGVKK